MGGVRKALLIAVAALSILLPIHHVMRAMLTSLLLRLHLVRVLPFGWA